jgi:hypothetical protein
MAYIEVIIQLENLYQPAQEEAVQGQAFRPYTCVQAGSYRARRGWSVQLLVRLNFADFQKL